MYEQIDYDEWLDAQLDRIIEENEQKKHVEEPDISLERVEKT